ncbi:MAG: hypothetical protein P4M09_13285, partial [Devosia sp.]|nr:hypothetical protein [Devosia sp.]
MALAVGVAILAGSCSSAAATPTSGQVGGTPSSSVFAGSGGAIPSPIDAGPPIPVLGTENFYADLLTQIGGTRVSATSLLNDPNADPHAFE